MKTIKPKTIEHGMCLFCDKRFVYDSNVEIERHMNIPLDVPFPTGLVYISSKGYNIITPAGRLLDGTEFGGHLTHNYLHQVATARYNSDEELEFEEELKTRKVKDLEDRFKTGQIRLPTLLEMSKLKGDYENYLLSKQTGSVYEVLKDLTPAELKGFVIERPRIPAKPPKKNNLIMLQSA